MLKNKIFWIFLLTVNVSSATLCIWLQNIAGFSFATIGALACYYMASRTDEDDFFV